jgi:uncharacterized protein YdiU (UPF0061 family)
MEAWQRRYKERKQEAYQHYRDKLMKTNRPSYIRATIFTKVVHEAAMKMAVKYMISLRQGDSNV